MSFFALGRLKNHNVPHLQPNSTMFMQLDRLQLKIYAFSEKFNVWKAEMSNIHREFWPAFIPLSKIWSLRNGIYHCKGGSPEGVVQGPAVCHLSFVSKMYNCFFLWNHYTLISSFWNPLTSLHYGITFYDVQQVWVLQIMQQCNDEAGLSLSTSFHRLLPLAPLPSLQESDRQREAGAQCPPQCLQPHNTEFLCGQKYLIFCVYPYFKDSMREQRRLSVLSYHSVQFIYH